MQILQIAALLAFSLPAVMANAADETAMLPQTSNGVASLGWNLVRAAGSGNVTVSPFSLWETLAMTHAGARGATAAEIAQVLGMPDDRDAVAAAAKSLREEIADAKGPATTLDVANRLWVDRATRIEDLLATTLKRAYSASVGNVDFVGHPAESRTEINRWVSERTARKIPELLSPEAITTNTRVVLTNAIYLKAPWADPFDKSATSAASFQLAVGDAVEVPFMRRSDEMVAGSIGEGTAAAATVCEIPYEGNRLSMVLVVPEAVDGLAAVLEGIDDWRKNPNDLADVVRREVNLSMPRWKVRQQLPLNAVLETMGMSKAFMPKEADFSGVDGTRDLFVSSVIQECFVEVAEEGTEAAAATATALAMASAPPTETLECRADRPFAWAIVSRESGVILFAGTVVDPR
jgi:serpin B